MLFLAEKYFCKNVIPHSRKTFQVKQWKKPGQGGCPLNDSKRYGLPEKVFYQNETHDDRKIFQTHCKEFKGVQS